MWMITYRGKPGDMGEWAVKFNTQREALQWLEKVDGIIREGATLWDASEKKYQVTAEVLPGYRSE